MAGDGELCWGFIVNHRGLRGSRDDIHFDKELRSVMINSTSPHDGNQDSMIFMRIRSAIVLDNGYNGCFCELTGAGQRG